MPGSKPELDRLIPREHPELALSWIDWRHPPLEIALPTLQVIRKREDAAFRHTRAWDSTLFVDGGEVKTWEELRHGPPLSEFTAASIIEVWDDLGSDGQVDYRFQGWRLVTTGSLEIALAGPERELLRFFETREEEW